MRVCVVCMFVCACTCVSGFLQLWGEFVLCVLSLVGDFSFVFREVQQRHAAQVHGSEG